jgi:triose-phosphate isomerase
VVIAPPSLYLLSSKDLLQGNDKIQLSAQNAYQKPSGAFTGEISVEQVKDAGIPWVILGHSERRTIFHETDDEVSQKVRAALDSGLRVILCVGETLEQREKGSTNDVVLGQTEAATKSLKSEEWAYVK